MKYHPDFVLTDARTGFTDIGGICCVQLPDTVFLVFNYGNQNLKGIRTVYNSLSDGDRIRRLRTGRDLKVHLLASMVPFDRPDLREQRRKEWEKHNLSPCVEIPYNPEVAFNETICTATYPDQEYCAGFREIADILIREKNHLSEVAEKSDRTISDACTDFKKKIVPGNRVFLKTRFS